MLFQTHLPAMPLSQFVDRFWFFSGGGFSHGRERVLPDGSAELVINLDDVPRKRFDRKNPRHFETVRHAWISGPQPEFIIIDVLPQATMMGVHFKPGGLAAFVPMPAGELSGALVELDVLWGRDGRDLRNALLETAVLPAKFHLLETFLLRRARGSLLANRAVSAAIHMLRSDGEVPLMAEIAAHLGMSHKHFIDQFRNTVGLSPKRFARIHRFQRALGDLHARREVDWVNLTGASGYYDQAHFINDFQAFSGLTPTRYLEQPGVDARFVPQTD